MTDTLRILTETAPLVLALLILAAILGVFIWAFSRIIVPVLKAVGDNTQAQQEAWTSIVKQQEATNKRLIETLERELKEEREAREKLEKIVSEMRETLDKQEDAMKTMRTDNAKLIEDNKQLRGRVKELESKDTPDNGNKVKQEASDKK